MTQDAERLALRRQCDDLQRRNAVLQGLVDGDQGERDYRAVAASVHDATSAAGALEQYDLDWFRSLPYSRPVVVRIAQRLIDATTAYPFLSVDHLRDIVQHGV